MDGDRLEEGRVYAVRAIVGLLPLRIPRQQVSTTWRNGYELIADPRYGMPDARDLLALLLCVDAAIRGASRVAVREPVSPASLRRIASVRLHLGQGDHAPVLPIANGWAANSPSIILTADWCAWVRSAPHSVELPWATLRRVSPGARMLAVALATEEHRSIAMAKLAEQCGCRIAHRRNAHQQVKRWLAELHKVGIDDWALDRDRAVVFRKARIDNVGPFW